MPLSYDTLQSSTLALVRSYNKNAGRFDPPGYEKLYDDIINMRQTYLDYVKQKAEENPAANLSYLKVIDSIQFLAQQLPKPIADSPQYVQQHNILLGAVCYRYLAVCKPYQKDLLGRFFSFLGVINIENTALYNTLQKLLNISSENVIDVLSTKLYCKAYLQYLERIDRGEDTGYIPELEKQDLFLNLRSKIRESEVEPAPLTQSIKYFDVIQWVDRSLCAIDEDVKNAINSWCKVMSKQKKEFPLLREGIIGCMSHIKPAPSSFVKVLLEYLLFDDAEFEDDGVSEFKQTLNQQFTEYKKYALQGMYALTLAQLARECKPDASLVKTLNTVIEGAQKDNGIALVGLCHFFENVDLKDMPDSLRCVWGSFPELLAKLKDEIATTEIPLDEQEGDEDDMVRIGL
jgi:hypothetical protein